MKSANDGNRDNDQHQHDIDAETPQQNASSKGKMLPTEVCPALRRNHLVGLEHRQNRTWIFQCDLFGVRRRYFSFPITLGGPGVI
jgi:hypothetical protein